MAWLTNRKGVTPVIAVVLLLLLTIGMVGILWTQAEDLMDLGDEASFLEDIDVQINTVTRNDTTDEHRMELRVENVGDEQYNLTDIARLEYSVPGEQSLQPAGGNVHGFTHSEEDENCFDDLEEITPGDVETCNTGVEMPDPDDSITVEMVESGGADSIASYSCSPSTSTSTTC